MANIYAWNCNKNERLKAERGFGLEEIVAKIELRGVLDDTDHPSPRYPHQRILFVALDDYVVAVPYVMDGDTKFLKNAFPSRRATKTYLKR